jgi:prepilin-type N-terminal cleavage/methylation domain-containing protein
VAIKLAGKHGRGSQAGLTLIEVMIALLVLAVAAIGLLAVFAMSVSTVYVSREATIAKQEAQQFIEGIYAARNTGAISFANIQNISQDATNGLFKDGWQPAQQAGPDGLMNTGDDLAALETGPNGQQLTLQRQIIITPFLMTDGKTVNPNLRQIEIDVQYGSGTTLQTYKEVTYISVYR